MERDRAPALTADQRVMLLTLIKEQEKVVKDRSSDARVIEKKKEAWVAITSHFNALNPDQRPRTAIQLKQSFNHIKRKVKQDVAAYKKKLYKTGDGPPPHPQLNEELALAASMMSAELAVDEDVFEKFVHPVNETEHVIVDVKSEPSTSAPTSELIQRDISSILSSSTSLPLTSSTQYSNSYINSLNTPSPTSFEHLLINPIISHKTVKVSHSNTPSPISPFFVAVGEPLPPTFTHSGVGTPSPTDSFTTPEGSSPTPATFTAPEGSSPTPATFTAPEGSSPTPATFTAPDVPCSDTGKRRLEEDFAKCRERREVFHRLKMEMAKEEHEMAKEEHTIKLKLYKDQSALVEKVSNLVEETHTRLLTSFSKLDSFLDSAKHAYDAMANSYK